MNIEYGIRDRGYRLWDMGYRIKDMGYGIKDYVNEIYMLRYKG